MPVLAVLWVSVLPASLFMRRDAWAARHLDASLLGALWYPGRRASSGTQDGALEDVRDRSGSGDRGMVSPLAKAR
eukprot:7889084-Pyramimonas_sp.AAC.1